MRQHLLRQNQSKRNLQVEEREKLRAYLAENTFGAREDKEVRDEDEGSENAKDDVGDEGSPAGEDGGLVLVVVRNHADPKSSSGEGGEGGESVAAEENMLAVG